MNTLVQVIVAAIVSAGGVGGILTYFNARKVTRTDYMDTVARTLTSDYNRVKGELAEVREKCRRLEQDLADERKHSRDLEARLAKLEQSR